MPAFGPGAPLVVAVTGDIRYRALPGALVIEMCASISQSFVLLRDAMLYACYMQVLCFNVLGGLVPPSRLRNI